MENLGETSIGGKFVNLETTDINELNSYLKSIREEKQKQKEEINNFLEQMLD